MRVARDKMIAKALAALDEVVTQCGTGPVTPSASLRFTLAFLYACSDGDRQPYDAFLAEIQDPAHRASSPYMGNYRRSSYATTYRTGIARSVGAIP